MSEERDTLEALLLRGTRLLHEGKAAEAIPMLAQAYAMDPENPDAALNFSGALILTGQFKKARPVLEALRDREVENAMVWTNLGAAHLGNPALATDEQQRKAIEAFERALELDEHAPSVAYNLGLIYRDRQERAEAARWFRRALKTNPGDRHARSLLKQIENSAD